VQLQPAKKQKGGGEEKVKRNKSKAPSQSPESSTSDDCTPSESGCPHLTKNIFYCMLCGGADKDGNYKGVNLTIRSYSLQKATMTTNRRASRMPKKQGMGRLQVYPRNPTGLQTRWFSKN
jgi:hypothetical protein